MSLVEFFSQPGWHRLGLTLVHFLWQGLAVAVIGCAAVRVLGLKRGNPRYAAYLLAFAAMAVSPLLTFMILGEPAASAPLTSAPAPAFETSGSLPQAVPALVPRQPPADALPVGSTYQPALRVRLDGALLAALPWALAGWMGGVLILSVRLLLGFLGVRRWRRDLEPLADDLKARVAVLSDRLNLRGFSQVFISRRALEAVALGYLRPVVLLPAALVTQMQPQMLEAIIAHELAHLRRLDLWINLTQRVVETLLFYHPAVWWLSSRLRSERELCCDELAVAATGERLTYASALETAGRVRLALRQPALAVGFRQDRKSTLGRVRHILGLPSSPPESRFWLAGVIAVVLLAVLAVPSTLVLRVRAGEKTSPEKKDTAESSSSVTSAEETRLERLKEVLARGMDVDVRDTWGHTTLHRVCMDNHRKVAEFLISKGADVNAGNITGITPLHTAAGRGHADIVKLLLDKKADVNARDDHDATPLWYAKNGVVYSFDVFGRFTANTMARWNPENPGCKKAVELLVARGAVEHAPAISLHEAADAGLMEKVKSLVAEGADVNAMDDRLAGTPLHLAAYSNQREVAEFLIAKGANVNARNRWDRTPLHIALDRGHAEIAERLRKHGARLEPVTEAARVKAPTSLFESAKFKSTIPEKNLQIPEQMQACAANLRKIHAAIKRYEKDKGQLPAWLSDLVPDYVSKEMLMCPDNPETEWKQQAADPRLPCGYVYEFGPTRAHARFGGAPTDGITQRDRKMTQVAYFGDVVPLCRCRLHGPTLGPMNLNISVGGKVYLSGPQWESLVMPDYKVGSEFSQKSSR